MVVLKILAILLILTSVITWSTAFILIKVGLKEIPPVTMAALRFSLGSIFLLALLFFKYKPREVFTYLRENLRMLSAMGFLGIFLPNIFQNMGMQYTAASTSSILQATGPVFAAILAVIILKESVDMRKIGGVSLAMTGAVMISIKGDLSLLTKFTDNMYGNLLIILSAICYAFYIIISKISLRDAEPLLIVSTSTAIGALFLLLLTPLVEPVNALMELNKHMWGIILALAAVPTFIGFLLWFEALKRMDASKASFFIFLIPVFTSVFAYVFLKEEITLFMIGNAALITAGVYLAESGK
jgi:drug/metabolite transporter (DMT)-like permease